MRMAIKDPKHLLNLARAKHAIQYQLMSCAFYSARASQSGSSMLGQSRLTDYNQKPISTS